MPDHTVSERLQGIWYGPTPPPWYLRVPSWLFGLGVAARRAAYAAGWLRTQHVGRPVIVVGNISVGGTGKTPLVIWLVEQLRAMGCAVGVVLRGYAARAAETEAVWPVHADSDPREVGDEALLIARRTGALVAVGRDRVSAARHLLRAGAEVIVADDGLQHLRLARDYEIAVVDGARGMGNGYLLPAGPLREPDARLAAVDAVVVNGDAARALPVATGAMFTMRLLGDCLQPLSGEGQPLPLASLAGKRVHALAGIGNPQRFFLQLAAAGLDVVPHPFPDHHDYQAHELDFGDALPLLMTEKDAVKCRRFAAPGRWYLPVAASFAPEQASVLLARLQAALARPRAAGD